MLADAGKSYTTVWCFSLQKTPAAFTHFALFLFHLNTFHLFLRVSGSICWPNFISLSSSFYFCDMFHTFLNKFFPTKQQNSNNTSNITSGFSKSHKIPFLMMTAVSKLRWEAVMDTLESSRTSSETKFGVCLGSLSCWKDRWCVSFSLLTDMMFSPWISWHLIKSIFRSSCCRFPVPEEPKQPRSSTEPPPCFTATSRHTADPSVQKVPVLIHSYIEQNINLYDFEHIRADYSCDFGSLVMHEFGHGVLQGLVCILLCKPLVATKSCWRSFVVTRGFVPTWLICDLVAATDSFLFLKHPGGGATVPLTLSCELRLQLYLLEHSVTLLSCHFPCLCKTVVFTLQTILLIQP